MILVCKYQIQDLIKFKLNQAAHLVDIHSVNIWRLINGRMPRGIFKDSAFDLYIIREEIDQS